MAQWEDLKISLTCVKCFISKVLLGSYIQVKDRYFWGGSFSRLRVTIMSRRTSNISCWGKPSSTTHIMHTFPSIGSKHIFFIEVLWTFLIIIKKGDGGAPYFQLKAPKIYESTNITSIHLHMDQLYTSTSKYCKVVKYIYKYLLIACNVL